MRSPAMLRVRRSWNVSSGAGGPRGVVVAQQKPPRLLVADAKDALGEEGGCTGVIGVMVRALERSAFRHGYEIRIKGRCVDETTCKRFPLWNPQTQQPHSRRRYPSTSLIPRTRAVMPSDEFPATRSARVGENSATC